MISPVGHTRIRSDPEGDGHLFAPRGKRLHMGVDLEVAVGQLIKAPCDGTITRKVRVYKDDPNWYGLELRGTDTLHKLFYVIPDPKLIGKKVFQSEVIGIAQNISRKYGPEMKPHIHWEIDAINPLLLVGL